MCRSSLIPGFISLVGALAEARCYPFDHMSVVFFVPMLSHHRSSALEPLLLVYH